MPWNQTKSLDMHMLFEYIYITNQPQNWLWNILIF